MRCRLPLACAAVLSSMSPAFGQDEGNPAAELADVPPTEVTSPAAIVSPVEQEPPQATSHVTVPALTPVSLEILADIGSESSQSGDTFPLRLAKPIVLDGREVIPAGVQGMGEVVHAKKRGGSGAGGELIVAARYLDVDGRQLPLRSMRFSAIGLDQMEKVQVVTALVGVIGLTVKGRDVEIRNGRLADAMTRSDFEMELDQPVDSTIVPENEQAVPENEPAREIEVEDQEGAGESPNVE